MAKFCIVCGNPLTGKQIKLCSDRECHREWKKEYDREYYHNNWEKKKGRSRKYKQDNRERIKESRRKNKPPQYCVVCGGPLPQYMKKLCSDECRRKWNKKYNHKWRLNNREKTNKRSCEWYQNNQEEINMRIRKRYRFVRGLPEDWDLLRESSIEVIMRRWLQESGIEFIQHHYINLENTTKTHVDFYIPEANICLYCDGDYWHGPKNPDIQERDVRINNTLEGMGYIVIRHSESDILAGGRPIEILEMIQ